MDVVFRDLTPGEKLAYQNVVSSRAKFHYRELADRFDAFASKVQAAGGDPKGPLFYSLNNVPMDEKVDIEMFLPIRQASFVEQEGLRFQSYFEVSPLLQGVVEGDIESQTEVVYAQLLATLEANDLEMNTPFFHVVHTDVAQYALVYVGYAESGAK